MALLVISTTIILNIAGALNVSITWLEIMAQLREIITTRAKCDDVTTEGEGERDKEKERERGKGLSIVD